MEEVNVNNNSEDRVEKKEAVSTPTPEPEPKKTPKTKSRKLGYLTIFLITVNSIMGTGIFFLPAVGVREAGLFSIFSWVLMGLIAIYFSMIFAELVGIFPKEGGVYEYAKKAFGAFPSFLLGWMTLIAANVTIAMLVVGAIKYVGPFLPNVSMIIISLAFIIMFNYMAFKGLKTGAAMLIAFAIITLVAVLGITIPGLITFNVANFTGWMQHASFAALPSGVAGIFGGMMLVFLTVFFIAETFFGWETATFLAEKVDNPKKVMPKVMIQATIFIAICSLLFVIASISLIPWQEFGLSQAPLAALASVIYGAGAVPIYRILVYLAIVGSVAGWIVSAPNLIVALAKDKMFLTELAQKHPKTGTPYKAIIFQTIFTGILVFVGAGHYEKLLHFLVPLVLILYSAVVMSLIVIRKKYPSIERPYKAPFGTIGPIILMIFTLGILAYWAFSTYDAIETIKIILSFIIFGIPIYLLLLFYYNPQATITFQNKTAGLSLMLERLFFPRAIRKIILQNADITDKTILHLGAASGLVGKEIAKRNPKKQIFVDHSKERIEIVKRKMKDHNHNTHYIHDEHLTSRIHPDVGQADEVFSIGILSNIDDEKRYLKHLARVVEENSKIHLFDYVDIYKFIPNKEFLQDLEKLKQTFADAGFAVSIIKKKGLFWNYLIIEGIRTSRTDQVFI